MFFFFLHSRSRSLNNLVSAIYPCRRGQFGQRYIAKFPVHRTSGRDDKVRVFLRIAI